MEATKEKATVSDIASEIMKLETLFRTIEKRALEFGGWIPGDKEDKGLIELISDVRNLAELGGKAAKELSLTAWEFSDELEDKE